MKNYYKTLGISQNCTKDDVKKAYRELALKYHPDKNTDERFSEHFKEINEAKQVLLDDLKKFQYDVSLAHFLSGTTIFPGVKYRRKKFYRRNVAFQIIKESVTNKFFIGFLFTITILLTIAFLTIPAEEPVLYSADKKSEGKTGKDPSLVRPVIAASYLVTDETKKLRFTNKIKKEPIRIKPITRATYSYTKKLKKHSLKTNIKKAERLVRVTKHRSQIKGGRSFASAAANRKTKTVLMELTHQKMIEILNDIKAEKQKSGSNSNCVQIIKTKTSNISNAFMLAGFLKGYGFVISGREKIAANSNGIDIRIMNDCIIVTIGVL